MKNKPEVDKQTAKKIQEASIELQKAFENPKLSDTIAELVHICVNGFDTYDYYKELTRLGMSEEHAKFLVKTCWSIYQAQVFEDQAKSAGFKDRQVRFLTNWFKIQKENPFIQTKSE